MPTDRLPRKEAREMVAILTTEGWTYAGLTGKHHLAFTHPSGARVYFAGTPSCRRAQVRTLAKARRRVRAAEDAREP
jgi:predicted RNA binding protein YcfA (HicA-like mRNA interferase family)